jgi:hypothetical protein
VVFSVLAALIIARQPRNRVGWLLLLPALSAAIPIEANLATPPAALTPGLWLLLWYDDWSWIPVIFAIFLIPLHFPTGRPPSPRWNWVNQLALGMWLFFILSTAFLDRIGPLNYDWTIRNPIGFIPLESVESSFLIVWGIGLVTISSASVASLVVRYRRAQAGERQQIKWLLYAGILFVIVYPVTYVLSDSEATGFARGWVDIIFLLSILAIGGAIAIAILRYRLFDIDVLIRRTLVYGALTALLALVYFGGVTLVQILLSAVSRQQSAIAIVISTLAIAALFNPLRRWIQDIIDRRFYRKKYDAEIIMQAFATAARDEVDMDKLASSLLGAVTETMQPERASLWMKPGNGGSPVAGASVPRPPKSIGGIVP